MVEMLPEKVTCGASDAAELFLSCPVTSRSTEPVVFVNQERHGEYDSVVSFKLEPREGPFELARVEAGRVARLMLRSLSAGLAQPAGLPPQEVHDPVATAKPSTPWIDSKPRTSRVAPDHLRRSSAFAFFVRQGKRKNGSPLRAVTLHDGCVRAWVRHGTLPHVDIGFAFLSQFRRKGSGAAGLSVESMAVPEGQTEARAS